MENLNIIIIISISIIFLLLILILYYLLKITSKNRNENAILKSNIKSLVHKNQDLKKELDLQINIIKTFKDN